ncbi:MAG: L-rhamnose/proton symporter RhaT [Terriglobia bacterium]
MTESTASGIILILAAGLLQGTFMLPIKYTHEWEWENTWLGFSVSGYLVLPWLVALLTVPQLQQILATTSGATLLKTFLWGLGWGLGGLLMGLGVKYVGLALGFALVIGLTAALGTLIPLLAVSRVSLTSPQGTKVMAGVVVALVGIAVCSWAGKLRDRASTTDGDAADSPSGGSFGLGLTLCILSGLLCTCGNLGFAFGAEITATATRFGTAQRYASYPLWALLTFPPFLCSGTYCVFLLAKNRTAGRFLLPGTGRNHLLAACMGAMWLGGMLLYGMGANALGDIGSSVGWALVMSLMVMVANLWGLLTGEWRGAGSRPLKIMGVGLTLLIVSMFIVGLGMR